MLFRKCFQIFLEFIYAIRGRQFYESVRAIVSAYPVVEASLVFGSFQRWIRNHNAQRKISICRRVFQQENQLSILYKIFAGIALFISCLGLYGLVLFIATQRTKEVGIRKVLGASIPGIVYLLSKEFILLILLAFIIASPIAYYVVHDWLQDYTYRIEPGTSTFVMTLVGCIIIGWATVGYRAIRAAKANPVKSLRNE